MPNKKWEPERLPKDSNINAIADQYHVKHLVGRIATSPDRIGNDPDALKKYLSANLTDLRDPYLLNDMDKTVNRIKTAIAKHEHIVVYGDYDADGITSTSIMYTAIKQLGGDVEAYLPSRFVEGYGPNPVAWQKIANRGTSLLITVDNGILVDDESLAVVNKNHMDLIITDHHEFTDKIPNVYAIVHAQYPGNPYPFDDFCGAGIAFKISCALLGHIDQNLLGLAAIGTVADIVTLQDENRVIVKNGLTALKQSTWPGIQAILKESGYDEKPLTSTDIGFSIAPALNALGRLSDATIGFNLITTDDATVAKQLAEKTFAENDRRKTIRDDIEAGAKQMAADQIANGHSTIIVGNPKWHQGVVGIVAGDICRDYNRPTIVMGHSVKNGNDMSVFTGSGRSIEGFDIVGALDSYRDHMLGMGGHPGACGLTITAPNIKGMRQQFDEKFDEYQKDHDITPKVNVTAKLDAKLVTLDTIKSLSPLEPYGHKNEQPIFEITDFHVNSVITMGKDSQSLKLFVQSNKQPDQQFEIVGFKPWGQDKDAIQTGLMSNKTLHIIGKLSINHFNGKTSPQVLIEDWHF